MAEQLHLLVLAAYDWLFGLGSIWRWVVYHQGALRRGRSPGPAQ